MTIRYSVNKLFIRLDNIMGDYGIVIPRYMGAQLKNDINGPSALRT